MMIKTLSKRMCAVSLCVIMALLAFNGWLTPVTQRLGAVPCTARMMNT